MTKHILEYSSTFNKGNSANNFNELGRQYGNGNKERQRKIIKVSKIKKQQYVLRLSFLTDDNAVKILPNRKF